ncbi:hypothetical protein RRSWK_00317 [Rhodopirellula sp. SWK7]|nr:hypothetical protein RRSWK_00317 [Rhodopirellula sp. SWK7]
MQFVEDPCEVSIAAEVEFAGDVDRSSISRCDGSALFRCEREMSCLVFRRPSFNVNNDRRRANPVTCPPACDL